MRSKTAIGALIGLLLAVGIIVFQWGVLFVALCAIIGAAVGAQLEGRIDLSRGLDGVRGGGRG